MSLGSNARLTVSEETLRLAAEAADIGFWDLDLTTNLLTWSERVKAAFGISPDVPCSMNDFYAGLHPDDYEATAAAFAAAIDPAQRTTYDVEYRTIGKEDRVIRWVAARGRGIFDDSGRCVRAIGTAIDITARRAADARLRTLSSDLEQQVAERTLALGRTWQLSPYLMGVLDTDGVFQATNPAWTAAFGWSEAELAQKNWRELVHPDDAAKSEAAWFEVIAQGMPVINFENRYRTKSGEWRWLSWVAVPEGGNVYFTTRDITEQKAQADALAEAQEALRQAQKIEAIGQLTGGIAHDFNNMLQGITGGIALAQRILPADAPVRKFLDLANTAANRAAALTSRLLAFGRRQPLDAKLVNLDDLIESMKDLIQRTVGPEVEIELRLKDGCWPVRCDPNQLESALLNIAINARDAMPDGGIVRIESEHVALNVADTLAWEGAEPGDYVRITVSDNGCGMTPDVLEHVFEPFFTTKPDGQGTGLGLSQIYGFIRQSHGVVRLESQLGVGTSVHLYLPRNDDAQEIQAPPANSELPLRDSEEGIPATVLLVEDEPTVRAAAAEALRQAGLTVIEAQHGQEGLTILQQMFHSKKRPGLDLLVADIGLPGGLNGRQLADAARSIITDLPVLLITGYAGDALKGRGHLEEGMALLAKPFELPVLIERVRRMLPSRRQVD